MLCMFVVLCVTWSLCSALTLPPPINLTMSSVNFHHILHWDPGPGTPMGTQYQVLGRVNMRKWVPLGKSMTTSLKLKLELFPEYQLVVQATLDGMVSNKSESYTFTPFTDTTISAPLVFLSGCGNCLEVNLSLPDPDESSKLSLRAIYSPKFRVKWNKRGGVEDTHVNEIFSSKEENYSFKISNLEEGVEYCVQVETLINVNKNTKNSPWTCSFTSQPKHSTVSVFLGVGASLLVMVTLLVSCVLVGLYYIGFLGKLHLPPALQTTLNAGYTLTPESTTPDHIHISLDTVAATDHAPLPPLEEGGGEEEEEEEEESKDYLDRGAELPPANTPGPHSAQEDCWRSFTKTVERGSKDDISKGVLYHDEDEGQDPVTAEGDQESEKEEPVREESEGSCNVNLLSLTLSAFRERGEDEEEDEKDRNTDDCSSYLLDQRLSHIEPTAKNIETIETYTPTSCEEEEEEGEFSDYMRHS